MYIIFDYFATFFKNYLLLFSIIFMFFKKKITLNNSNTQRGLPFRKVTPSDFEIIVNNSDLIVK